MEQKRRGGEKYSLLGIKSSGSTKDRRTHAERRLWNAEETYVRSFTSALGHRGEAKKPWRLEVQWECEPCRFPGIFFYPVKNKLLENSSWVFFLRIIGMCSKATANLLIS